METPAVENIRDAQQFAAMRRRIAADWTARLDNAPTLFLWVFVAIAVVLRRPDAILNAQFWAEDGTVWFADAYNKGALRAILLPYNGYFGTLPRVTAAIATLLPLAYVPLLMNVIALAVEISVPVFLLSDRFAHIATRRVRLLMAFLLVAMPTSFEIHGNITNSQWFVAVLMFMVLVADARSGRCWRAFDISVILLGGLSGPFCILLLPIAAVMLWVRRDRWHGLLLCVLSSAAVVQIISILHTPSGTRTTAPLGASPLLLSEIIGAQVFFGPILGPSLYSNLLSGLLAIGGVMLSKVVFVVALASWVAICVYALVAARVELRLFTVFALMVLISGLVSPATSPTLHQPPIWRQFLDWGMGGRYWFLPVVSTYWTYLWMANTANLKGVRLMSVVFLSVAIYTGLMYWQRPALVNLKLPQFAREFALMPNGSHMKIPINPPGWPSMELIKH